MGRQRGIGDAGTGGPAPSRSASSPTRPGCRSGRLRDGPATLRAGDGPSGFTVRVHNTGRVTCHRVHPVVLLIDEDRALAPSQLRLDFHDGRRWTPVRLHHTSRRENVGVLDGGKGFRGFTVGPGERRDVRLRLAVREDAGPGRVAVRTALVQHHDRDGRWVGHSDTYTFALRAADGTGPRRPVPPPHPPGNEQPADRRDATPTPVRPPAVPAPPEPLAPARSVGDRGTSARVTVPHGSAPADRAAGVPTAARRTGLARPPRPEPPRHPAAEPWGSPGRAGRRAAHGTDSRTAEAPTGPNPGGSPNGCAGPRPAERARRLPRATTGTRATRERERGRPPRAGRDRGQRPLARSARGGSFRPPARFC
ncbi:hypothetical protein Sgou_44070 [Streptomyces gougerotii]|uniref:DUF4232 domain-containing protein n=1 Tax=Streptomyces gougerotii TaxID=53448 RepID=A0ABQ1DB00_9ACTN|nr:hypothetical protein [Streptomyces gougerotii]GFH79737.1 hypothetical protein Sgou_44070 [Streptomyces gougerotii]